MSKHQPALLGGLFIGVLSSLPVVSAANLCCCLWVVAGGVLVVYLQQQNTPGPVATGDAALGGVMAGAIGGVLFAAANAALHAGCRAGGAGAAPEPDRATPRCRPKPPPSWNVCSPGRDSRSLMFGVAVPLYAVFALLGALLGLAIFRKKTPPQPPQAPAVEG